MSFQFILVRGLIREAGHWGPFVDQLKPLFPTSQFHCLDIPGAGSYYRSPTPTSIPKIVLQMRENFLALNLSPDRPIVLVAISLGGMVAAEWLKNFPQDFAQAILINTSFGGHVSIWQRLKPQALLQLLPVPLLKGEAKELQILKVVSNRPERYEELAQQWNEIARQRPVSLANTIRQLWAAATFKAPTEKPKIPVLILASTHDRMVDVECSRHIAHSWSMAAVENSTAGHDLPSDEADWTIDQIQRFLHSPASG